MAWSKLPFSMMLSQIRKGDQGKAKQIFTSYDVDCYAYPNKKVVKRRARGERGMLSCCKCLFEQIKANLAHIHLKNLQNFQKCVFGKTLYESMGYSFPRDIPWEV